MAGVVTTLRDCRMENNEATALVKRHPEFFDGALNITKGISNQHRNIIVTISYLQYIKETYPSYAPYKYKRFAHEALKYQLKNSSNWRVIASTLSRTMHLLNGQKLMTDEDIENDLHPSKLMFDIYLH